MPRPQYKCRYCRCAESSHFESQDGLLYCSKTEKYVSKDDFRPTKKSARSSQSFSHKEIELLDRAVTLAFTCQPTEILRRDPRMPALAAKVKAMAARARNTNATASSKETTCRFAQQQPSRGCL